jgi:hypothetical protein
MPFFLPVTKTTATAAKTKITKTKVMVMMIMMMMTTTTTTTTLSRRRRKRRRGRSTFLPILGSMNLPFTVSVVDSVFVVHDIYGCLQLLILCGSSEVCVLG